MKFKLDERDIKYIESKGIETIRRHASEIISTRIAPANPKNDTKQTPFKGHPVFKAQHATATCCRKCISKWHRITRGTELTKNETDHVVGYIMHWMSNQLEIKHDLLK